MTVGDLADFYRRALRRRLRVIWIEEATEPLAVGNTIPKCRVCVQQEQRRKEAR